MGRAPCCSKVGLRRGPWSSVEDGLLTDFIQQNGEGQWRSLPKKAGLLRCGKSCRLRWMNYLRPGIKRGNISQDEEDLIVRLHGLLGNRWSLIAGRLPGRTDNEIKNYWNTYLLKKLNNAGIHPNPAPQKPAKANTSAKRKTRGKPTVDTNEAPRDPLSETDAITDKIKVYSPKAIKLSSSFSRTDSLDSLPSGSTSSSEASPSPAACPIFELETPNNDFLGDRSLWPLSPSAFSDGALTLDQVYDVYLSLL